MKKFIKYFVIGLLGLLFIAYLGLHLTGNAHLIKGIRHTYLAGRTGVTIDQSHIFAHRTIHALQPRRLNPHRLYNTTVIPPHFKTMLDTLETEALFVLKDGATVHEWYHGEMGKTQIINGFSMAKSVVALLLAKSIETGALDLNDPVSKFLSWKNFTQGPDTLRIWHLAGMCSGINFEEAYTRDSPFSFTAKAYFGDDLEAIVNQYSKTEMPGGDIDYQSGNTQLLGMVIAAANGQSLSELSEKWLWKPLGMEADATWSLDHENGHEKAYCCIQSIASDWAKIGQLMLQSGRWNGNQLIDSALVSQLIAPSPCRDTATFSKHGLGWWRYQDARGDLYYARGILGQYLICAPSKNIVLVRLGHRRGAKLPNDHPIDFVHLVDMIYEVF